MKKGRPRRRCRADLESAESQDDTFPPEAQMLRKRQKTVPLEEPRVIPPERPRTRAMTRLMATTQPGTSFSSGNVRRRITLEGGNRRTRRRTEAELLASSAQEAGFGPVLQPELPSPIMETAELTSPRMSQTKSISVAEEEIEERRTELLRVSLRKPQTRTLKIEKSWRTKKPDEIPLQTMHPEQRYPVICPSRSQLYKSDLPLPMSTRYRRRAALWRDAQDMHPSKNRDWSTGAYKESRRTRSVKRGRGSSKNALPPSNSSQIGIFVVTINLITRLISVVFQVKEGRNLQRNRAVQALGNKIDIHPSGLCNPHRVRDKKSYRGKPR